TGGGPADFIFAAPVILIFTSHETFTSSLFPAIEAGGIAPKFCQFHVVDQIRAAGNMEAAPAVVLLPAQGDKDRVVPIKCEFIQVRLFAVNIPIVIPGRYTCS